MLLCNILNSRIWYNSVVSCNVFSLDGSIAAAILILKSWFGETSKIYMWHRTETWNIYTTDQKRWLWPLVERTGWIQAPDHTAMHYIKACLEPIQFHTCSHMTGAWLSSGLSVRISPSSFITQWGVSRHEKMDNIFKSPQSREEVSEGVL